MASSDTPRSPMELWKQLVPPVHDTGLRNAFYNVAAAVFVGGAVAAAWSVYLILQPFVQALMWAVLCGSVLHPIKYKIATSVREWLTQVDQTKSLLSISLVFMPVTCLDNLSEFVGWYVMNHVKAVTAVTVLLPIFYLVIHHTPSALSHFAFAALSFLFYSTKFCLNIIGRYNYIFLLGIILYFIKVLFFLTPENEHLYRRLNIPIWLLLSALVSGWCPSASVFLFLLFILLLCGGICTQAVDLSNNSVSSDNNKDVLALLKSCLGWNEAGFMLKECGENENSSVKLEDIKPSPDGEPETEDKEFSSETVESISSLPEEDHLLRKDSSSMDSESSSTRPENIKRPTHLRSFGEKEEARRARREKERKNLENSSNMYLKTVFVACVLVELWRHSYLLSLLPLTIGYYIVKKFTSYHIFEDGFIKENISNVQDKINTNFGPWFESRKHVLFTPPLLGILKMLKKTDRRIVKILVVSVDGVVTILIMLACLMFVVIASIFLAVQIQGEGMHLITMGSQVINATIVNNPQLHEMLPEGLNKVIGSALDNGYLYGRDVIGNMIRNMVGEANEEKAAELEQQVIELWDHIYQAWVAAHPQPPFKGPVVTSEAVAVTFDTLIDGLLKTPELISISKLSAIIKDNLGTVMNVAEGVWTILLSNLNLVVSATTTLFSLLLGGSLSILNAILNLVVFLSSLFYILSISNEVYKPVAILSSLSPGQMNSLGSAFEESVNGVFKASFKMGLFYGMWTWLLHSIFATNIVYIPSVLGALFGAVPLVGTYWAAVPGALELAWGHESPFLGLLLIAAQLLPLSCVDTAFYAEIKGGGHPYLTGLAVAGGIFCWGVEGAILGPLLLCILLVVTKMYTSLIHSPTDFLQKYRRLRR